MVFTGETKFDQEGAEYLRTPGRVTVQAKPYKDPGFDQALLGMIERSRKKMDVWGRIQRVRQIISDDNEYDSLLVGPTKELLYVASKSLNDTLSKVSDAAKMKRRILIHGEPGTGKELLAAYYWTSFSGTRVRVTVRDL